MKGVTTTDIAVYTFWKSPSETRRWITHTVTNKNNRWILFHSNLFPESRRSNTSVSRWQKPFTNLLFDICGEIKKRREGENINGKIKDFSFVGLGFYSSRTSRRMGLLGPVCHHTQFHISSSSGPLLSELDRTVNRPIDLSRSPYYFTFWFIVLFLEDSLTHKISGS
jgi:hypothetical protein